jgi:hypothetical protein
MNTYGVTDTQGSYTDVSNSERGAKNFATRNGYTEVYIRFNSGYHIDLVSTKLNNNTWSK